MVGKQGLQGTLLTCRPTGIGTLPPGHLRVTAMPERLAGSGLKAVNGLVRRRRSCLAVPAMRAPIGLGGH